MLCVVLESRLYDSVTFVCTRLSVCRYMWHISYLGEPIDFGRRRVGSPSYNVLRKRWISFSTPTGRRVRYLNREEMTRPEFRWLTMRTGWFAGNRSLIGRGDLTRLSSRRTRGKYPLRKGTQSLSQTSTWRTPLRTPPSLPVRKKKNSLPPFLDSPLFLWGETYFS